jgi:hypothetical protein
MDVGAVKEAKKLAKVGTLTRQSSSSGLTTGTWFTFLNVAGAGHLLSFAAHCAGWSSTGNVPLRITVDGGTSYTIGNTDNLPRAYDGSTVASTLLITPIRFSTSLIIEAQQNSGSAQTIDTTGYLMLS